METERTIRDKENEVPEKATKQGNKDRGIAEIEDVYVMDEKSSD